jgi:large subunit ribosomal protein L1
MNDQDVLKALAEVRKAPKKKFTQSIDIIANLQGIDFKNPSSKIDLKIVLPAGRGKEIKVGAFGDSDFLNKAKTADLKIPDKQISKTPKEIRKIAQQMDFFVAQTTLMVDVGKIWGKFLSTRGKMPQPLPPAADPTPMITRLKGTVALRTRGNTPQSLSCAVGTEAMKDEDLVKNILAVYNALMEKLPGRENNLKAFIIKETMGVPVKLVSAK